MIFLYEKNILFNFLTSILLFTTWTNTNEIVSPLKTKTKNFLILKNGRIINVHIYLIKFTFWDSAYQIFQDIFSVPIYNILPVDDDSFFVLCFCFCLNEMIHIVQQLVENILMLMYVAYNDLLSLST